MHEKKRFFFNFSLKFIRIAGNACRSHAEQRHTWNRRWIILPTAPESDYRTHYSVRSPSLFWLHSRLIEMCQYCNVDSPFFLQPSDWKSLGNECFQSPLSFSSCSIRPQLRSCNSQTCSIDRLAVLNSRIAACAQLVGFLPIHHLQIEFFKRRLSCAEGETYLTQLCSHNWKNE